MKVSPPVLFPSKNVPLAVATASAHDVPSFPRGQLGGGWEIRGPPAGGVVSHQPLLAVGAVETGQLIFRFPQVHAFGFPTQAG